ncbi:MAG: hypothetical protein MZW92_51135 [Comamonadaceae bacterium]|nr:hypothetical protein [Comamonadaceae bacterium]
MLDDGRKVTLGLVATLIPEELGTGARHGRRGGGYAGGSYEHAARLFAELTAKDDFAEFLTLPAYALID